MALIIWQVHLHHHQHHQRQPVPKTAPTLPRKNVKTELNGLLKILLKPNLNAPDAKSAVKPKLF